MLKKCIKKIIIFMWIFSFIFPIYADYDENSYLTREIFEAGLKEFNESLTAFEAGINSRIDVQVTSYLDRNGIWSPMEQVIDETKKSYTFQPPAVTIPSSGNYGGNTNYGGPFDYIKSINKTGLIFGTYKWKSIGGSSTESRFGWSGEMNINTNWRSDLGMCFVVSLYEYKGLSSYEADRTLKYSNILFTSSGTVRVPSTGGTTHILCATIPNSYLINQYKFFVEKGDNLKWEGMLVYHFGCCNYANPMTNDINKFEVVMGDANVY